MLRADGEVNLLQRSVAESLLGVIDGNSIVALLSADSLELLDVSPVLDDFSIMTGKILTLENSPFGFKLLLILE
jgi:hypothetical protein